MSSPEISKAAKMLQQGEVVVIPTETVYGLAANIYDATAVRSIFELKGRPSNNPLIVHIKSFEVLSEVAKNIPDTALKLASHFWPGPLTLVLEKQDTILDVITAGGNTVAVRMPNHPIALNLLQETGFPLAAPSANPSNYISPTSAENVRKAFGERAPFILDGGPCQKGIESTVVGFKSDGVYLYRHGAITKEALEAALDGVEIKTITHESASPASPGMLLKHYSPRAKLIHTADVKQHLLNVQGKQVGVLSFNTHYTHPAIAHQLILSPSGNLEEAAQGLFNALYELDSKGLDIILAEVFPEEGLGLAINDRLGRAAAE
ncbi:L-threonylcarbamoyladenylate synthase [Desertivirga brevis]|uniref:L-threonylcarbamoyladenylate synthase n=1 Tax=Desertivirga brevis TaxID=2810310 RepID=UPI001A95F3A4|nr:L-threonylcarbamoyladenylate synthase [Pedobacter sp. SYSU D00873]